MPTSAEPELLVDTSVAVALAVADHEHHESTRRAVGTRRLGLSGHAAFETFSVLTRLPPPARRTPATVVRLLRESFPHSCFLSPVGAEAVFDRLSEEGIGGGAVYDALVGAAAREHGVPLATRDRRALDTYRALNVQVEFIE
jgi:predicted nucleic acid-binding protein